MLLRSKLIGCALIFVGLLSTGGASSFPSGPSPVLVQRAEKIAGGLGLEDATKRERVRDIIARQYHDLGLVHARRDAAIQSARSASGAKGERDSALAVARAEATAAQDKLHGEYLTRLAAELTPEQVDQVKDGMTYGVLPLTFGVYQQMLPDLPAEQKAQILAWLTEAREHAMDASTSEEKHGWFGKYKGRINNYLSAAGYNMKEAEKNLRPKK